MGKTWLLIDAPNLCWRSFYAMGGLSHNGESTAVSFGLLRDWLSLREKFAADGVVFAFDKGRPLRCTDFPAYKAHRSKKAITDEEKEKEDAKRDVRFQIEALCEHKLYSLGFSNVLSQEGYEADDVIASVVDNLEEGDQAVIVSSDKDLYQCISSRVSAWTGKKLLTLQGFRGEYGLSKPSRWADVKAIAGCVSDGIRGIQGVGEKTALKYLAKTLPKDSAYHKRIEGGLGIWELNLDLVRLPYCGVKVFTLRDDRLTLPRWNEFCDRYGFSSLKNAVLGRKERTLFDA